MRWQDEVNKAASHWGAYYGVTIDPALVHAIIERESAHGLAPNYVSHGGAVPEPGGHTSFGPMQIYDTTATTVLHLGFPAIDLATHPELGIWYGTKYLASLVKQFGGDVVRAVSAYNAGPGNAKRNSAGKFPNQPYVDYVVNFWNKNKAAVVIALPALALAAAAVYFLSRSRRRAA